MTDLIGQASEGVPRKINVIADAVLLFGYGEDKHVVDASLVHEVITELAASGVLVSRCRRRPSAAPRAAEADVRPRGCQPRLEAGTGGGRGGRRDRTPSRRAGGGNRESPTRARRAAPRPDRTVPAAAATAGRAAAGPAHAPAAHGRRGARCHRSFRRRRRTAPAPHAPTMFASQTPPSRPGFWARVRRSAVRRQQTGLRGVNPMFTPLSGDDRDTSVRLIFWLSALTVVYVYAGYPALLVLWARLRPLPAPRGGGADARSAWRINRHRRAKRSRRGCRPASTICSRSSTRPIGDRSSWSRTGPRTARWPRCRRFGTAVETVDVPACGKAAALNAGVAARNRRVPGLCRRPTDVRAGCRARARRPLCRPGHRRRHRRVAPRLRSVGGAGSPGGPRAAPGAGSTVEHAPGAGRAGVTIATGAAGSSPRLPTASVSTGATKSCCDVSRASSGPRSARPARSTPCGARSISRCRRTRSSTMC